MASIFYSLFTATLSVELSEELISSAANAVLKKVL